MIVIVMGVAGCGKTTVGRELARRLGCGFLDADDFHPAANIARMSQGIALQDADRWPWLDKLHAELTEARDQGRTVVLACSALRQRYRDRIVGDLSKVRWVHLKGGFELISSRLASRQGHYMKAGMLRSQFETLEAPPNALELDVAAPPEALVETTLRWLQ